MDDDVEDNNILYDLTVHHEWTQENEGVNKQQKEKSSIECIQRAGTLNTLSNVTWTALRSVGVKTRLDRISQLSEKFVDLIQSQIPWRIVTNKDGELLAILQDQFIEIRDREEDYSTVQMKFDVGSDTNPHWRSIAFDDDNELIAYADSCGNVIIYELSGTEICKIPGSYCPMGNDYSKAVCALIFVDAKKLKKRNILKRLMVITYRGILKCYNILNDGTAEFSHEFSFCPYYQHGVSGVVYVPKYDLLLMGGTIFGTAPICPTSTDIGLSAWRMLSDQPYYKLVTNYDDDVKSMKHKEAWRRLKSYTFSYKTTDIGIFKFALTENGQKLAAIHNCGSMSVWDVPSLRLRVYQPEKEQPLFNQMNQEKSDNPKFRKTMKEFLQAYFLNDINWWNDNSIILSRGTGNLTIIDEKIMSNIMGDSPQWFEPSPRLSLAKNGSVVILECERKLQKRRLEDVSDYDDSDDEDYSILRKSSRMLTKALYSLTEKEQYRSARKKPKITGKIYRLVSLSSTTPEELYSRKIDLEEYGEAIILAQNYHLDTDLVYQTQWKKSQANIHAIKDYLSKVKNRSWVLNECINRVPDDIDAARELLEFGLGGTDIETLVRLQDVNDGKFTTYNPADDTENDDDNDAIRERKMNLAKTINFSNISEDGKEICKVRLLLLQYLDRLKTYEDILGGVYFSAERYEADVYKKFRRENIVKATLDFTRAGNWTAVDIMFSYYGEQLIEHKLPILSNFPETLSPSSYRSILPECSMEIEENADDLDYENNWRLSDWCEEDFCKKYVQENKECNLDILYLKSDLDRFRGNDLSEDKISEWYLFRAKQIESLSNRVDYAIELLIFGMENNVKNLDQLKESLLTLELLVYECQVADNMNLEELNKLNELEKIKLMMSTSPEEMFAKNTFRWLLPFLERSENSDHLLKEYLIELAKENLKLCSIIFQHSKYEMEQRVITNEEILIESAVNCIYSCQRNDQLNVCFEILECLSEKRAGSSAIINELHNRVDELEICLSAAEILEKIEYPCIISFIRDTMKNEDASKKFFRDLLHSITNRIPKLEAPQLIILYNHLKSIRSQTFSLFKENELVELFVKQLLLSSDQRYIDIASRMMERSLVESSTRIPDRDFGRKVDYKTGVEIVVEASKEYFDAAAGIADSNMELAKSCLSLIKDKPKAVRGEWDLLEAYILLDEFGANVLPLQLRLSDSKAGLIKKAIKVHKTSYKFADKLLKLGLLLKIEEGVVLMEIIQAAIDNDDSETAVRQCLNAIKIDFPGVWQHCKLLANDKKTSYENRLFFLKYSSLYCPENELDDIIKTKLILEKDILSNEIKEKNFTESIKNLSKVDWKNFLTENVTQALFSNENYYKSLKNGDNKMLEKYGLHAFFGGKANNSNFFNDFSQTCYESLNAVVPTTSFHRNYCVIRLASLEKSLEVTEQLITEKDVNEALINLARETLSNDFALSSLFLSNVTDESAIEEYLESLPKTEVTLDLKIYAYALKLIGTQKGKNTLDFSFKRVHDVEKYINTTESELGKKLEAAKEAKEQFVEAKKLQNLGKGVDAERFMNDEEYKKETILGLIMTIEDGVYNLAVQLAKRYKIDIWDVYMTHVEFLFEESELKTNEIEARLENRGLLRNLLKQEERLADRIINFVLPIIDGRDYERILYIFHLLEKIDKDKEISNLSITTHIKLLKKLKSLSIELDYKKLTNGKENSINVLEPILTTDNINSLAKLAYNLTDGKGNFLQPSAVYRIWCSIKFWKSDCKKENEWLKNYENCTNFIAKLIPEHLIEFMDDVTFSEKSLKNLNTSIRIKLNKRALDLAQSLSNGANGNAWKNAAKHFETSINHLQSLTSSKSFEDLRQRDDMKGYVDLVDLCRSDKDKFKEICIKAALEGKSVKFVEEFMSLNNLSGWTVKVVFCEALKTIIDEIQNDESKLRDLERVAKEVHLYETEWVEVLNILGNIFDLNSDDSTLLALYRTKTIISKHWNIDSSNITIGNSKERLELIKTLLEMSNSADEFLAITDLTKSWSEFNEGDLCNEIWLSICLKLIETMDKNSSKYITGILDGVKIGEEVVSKLFSALKLLNLDICAIRIVLNTEHTSLYENSMTILENHVEPQPEFRNELLDIVLKRHLVSSTLNTPYYAVIYDKLLESTKDSPYHLRPEVIANQLIQQGYPAIGASLLLAHKGSATLRTFSNALSFGKRERP
ncbi:DgyrCDS348 [Dimorphilus gyrociliatus]|uniref:DgyrCDS348 n=1 Tax=Dimorphilus gyrociliatus TaxID=2664684 RepID=A0A7I8V8Q6_9ANNE|nr:DgyrCDS348 [Dimorphilus gyrociliatus]